MTACVPAPSDPVETGRLCLPDSVECPSTTLIARNAVGRNQLDYAIQNGSSTEAEVTAQAHVPAADVDAGGDMGGDVGDDGRILITRSVHRVPPNDSVGNRWTPQILGTRNEIEFSMECSGCQVSADYVLTSVPLECSIDDDCSSGWLCDTRTPGRCVECMSEDDCTKDQTCDIQQGRCTPPADASCSSTAGLPSLLLVVLGIALWRRRRLGSLAMLLGLMVPATVAAAPPVASLGVGVGTQIFTGEVGKVTEAGLSLSIAQDLRWQYAGLSLGVATSYFLTNQPSPPFSRDLRTVEVLAGPRGYLPIGPAELVLSADYMRMGLDSNSLVRITGPNLNYNALSLGGGVRYRWSGLEARLDAAWQLVFDFPGDLVWLQLSIAIAAGG